MNFKKDIIEIFLTGCLLGTVFSIPSSTSLPQGRDDRFFTTTRKSKVIIDMNNLPKVKAWVSFSKL